MDWAMQAVFSFTFTNTCFPFEVVLNALLTCYVCSMLSLQQLGHYGIDDDVAALKRDKHVLMMELVRLRQQQQVHISMSRMSNCKHCALVHALCCGLYSLHGLLTFLVIFAE